MTFMFFSIQSQSHVTIKTLPVLTAIASPHDSAVMETTTAWIIQMRQVFTITFVFYLPRLFHLPVRHGKYI